MESTGTLQVLILTTSADLVDRATDALRDQLSAPAPTVCRSVDELAAAAGGAAVVVVDLRVTEQSAERSIATIRALTPGTALLALAPRGSSWQALAGADGFIELDHAMAADQRLLAHAIRNAVNHHATRSSAEGLRRPAEGRPEPTVPVREPASGLDPLTGLPGRQLLHALLDQALAGARVAEQQVAVALFDLDQFKRVNATWGHAAGDELLHQVAARLAQLVPAEDRLSRFADDEFVAVRPGVASTDEAQEWAAQLFTAFDEPFALTGAAAVAMTASVGLYVAAAADSVEDILHGLDVAVRAAGTDGRGRTRLYNRRPRSRGRVQAPYRGRAARRHLRR